MTKRIPKLSVWLADSPQRMLEIMDSQTTLLTLTVFPEYAKVHKKIHVRIHDLPDHDSLRDLRYALTFNWGSVFVEFQFLRGGLKAFVIKTFLLSTN